MTDNTCAPPDPSVGGWHWLEFECEMQPAFWHPPTERQRGWYHVDGDIVFPKSAVGYRYAGPCPTPADMAERERLLRALARCFAKFAMGYKGIWTSAREAGLIKNVLNEDIRALTDLGRAAVAAAKEAGGE